MIQTYKTLLDVSGISLFLQFLTVEGALILLYLKKWGWVLIREITVHRGYSKFYHDKFLTSRNEIKVIFMRKKNDLFFIIYSYKEKGLMLNVTRYRGPRGLSEFYYKKICFLTKRLTINKTLFDTTCNVISDVILA